MSPTASLPSPVTPHRLMIIITIMMAAVLEVLDSTIVNVSLPSMMPALSANANQITWVLTAYVVASAIMLPLTGFMSNMLGRKRMMFLNITGFMLSSLASGMATSLSAMVLFRCIQGASGAALIPLSQSILRETFPLHEQGKAMAIWGLGIMMAPVFGPTLGGYITEDFNWRWIFYINIPVCLTALVLTHFFIPQTRVIKQHLDTLGLILMVIGIGCLQLFLDQGNDKNWFESHTILLLCLLSIIGIIGFLFRCLFCRPPLIDLSLYKNRNFSIASLIMLTFSGCLFGVLTLEPILLEHVFHYPIITTGWVLAPLGLASAIGMVSASFLMRRCSVKWLLTIGLALASLSAMRLAALSPMTSMHYFLITNALLGLGMGLIMVPLSTYALATIERGALTEGSGLFAYSRMLGTSIGISLLSTLVSEESQINWNTLSAHINRFSDPLQHWLALQHEHLFNPMAIEKLARIVNEGATLQAFIDAYYAVAIAFLLLIPWVWFFHLVDLRKNAPLSAH